MKKQKTSTKKTKNQSDPDLQVPSESVDKSPETARQAEPLTLFDVQQRRMAREAK